jgi:acylphosphatase
MTFPPDGGAPYSRARVRVLGHVQGVFFRASTQAEAARLGVTGYVRNCSDGSVEFVAVGQRAKVQDLIDWAHRGPDLAKVTSVVIEDDLAPLRAEEEAPGKFTIRR